MQSSGVSAGSGRGPIGLPLVWLLVVLALAWHQWDFWRAPRLGTDVFALLPQDEQQPAAQQAMKQLTQHAERRVVAMVGAPDWASAKAAAQRFDAALQAQGAGLQRVRDTLPVEQLMAFYAPWRDALLTDAQRAALPGADVPRLAAQSLSRLHGLSTGQPTAWVADPLGLWPAWWEERGGLTAARPREGLLWLRDERAGRDWVVLLYETRDGAFRFDGQRRWGRALEQAEVSARAQ